MKIRIIAVIYTILMAAVLKFVLDSFTQNDFERRDVVYYNDIIEQINDEYNSGMDISSIEQKFDCDIVLFGDEDYTSTVYKYYGTYGLVADFAPDKAAVTDDNIIGKICFASEENAFTDAGNNVKHNIIIVWGVMLAAGYILMLIIYINYIRPFHELQHFTTEIAKGNLDVALPIHKENMFGAFTESFDVMREELAASKKREAEAEKSKKELVAQLSHDIKTPVATIKATCEVLEMKERIRLNKLQSEIQDNEGFAENNYNPGYEKEKAGKLTEVNFYSKQNGGIELQADEINSTLEKIGYISDKADTIDQLISNMFQATLEELEVLEVKPVETDSRVLNDIFAGISQTANIIMSNELPECLVYMDRLRMEQVIGNIIGNSVKYAGPDINVFYSFCEEGVSDKPLSKKGSHDTEILVKSSLHNVERLREHSLHNTELNDKNNKRKYLKITIRDHGFGVPGEDIYSITEKFYRGSNTDGKQGSGLGLYLAKYFMEKQLGGFECYNHKSDQSVDENDGFVVELYLRKV